MKAIRWMEAAAEFPDLDCAGSGRLAWAAKGKIVEALSEGAPLTKRGGASMQYVIFHAYALPA